MNLLIISEIGEAILHSFRTLAGILCSPVYTLIELFYNIFSYLATYQFIEYDSVNEIYRKVGYLLGTFMVFKLSFSLIQTLIDPTKFKDEKKGYWKIAYRCIISLVLFGITPFLFKEALNIQNLVVGNGEETTNILYRLIIEDNHNLNIKNFGRRLANELFFSFYVKNDDAVFLPGADTENNEIITGDTYDILKRRAAAGEISYYKLTTDYLTETDENGVFLFEFEGVLCLIVGVLAAYYLLSFCIQTAIRVFQIAFLQLIAPIPILSYISDPDGAFKKWLKQCTTTYLDLFMRLGIIYFVIYFSDYIILKKDEINGIYVDNAWFELGIEIFLILGLFYFAKKVPNLIKELFPSNSNAASLSIGNKEAGKLLSFGAGTVTGGIAGMATGIRYGKGTLTHGVGGAITGLGRGMFNGAKTNGKVVANTKNAINNQRAAMMKAYERNNDGSKFWGRNFAAYENQRTVEAYDKEMESYSDFSSTWESIDKELEKQDSVKYAMQEKQTIMEQMAKGEYGIQEKVSVDDYYSNSTGEKIVTRPATDAEKEAKIKELSENIEKAKQVAFRNQLAENNSKVRNLVDNAEAIRSKGKEKGYSGYGDTSLTEAYNTAKDADKSKEADALFKKIKDTKKSGQTRTHDIKDIGGGEYEAYKQAKANSQYAKK